MARSLVIVESPAKAKTINRYLGNDYIVKSSVGHIRDLPVGGKTSDPKAHSETSSTAGGTVSFSEDIKPLLADSCVNCHNLETLPGRPSFETRELAIGQGVGDGAIIPGDPDRSRMIRAISLEDTADTAMPPVGHRVSEEQVALLKRWIAEGADWPAGENGRIRPTSNPME